MELTILTTLKVWGTFTLLYNHHHHPSLELCHLPKPKVPIKHLILPPLPEPLGPPLCFLSLWTCLCWMPHISGIRQDLSLVMGLFYFTYIFEGHPCCSLCPIFFFKAEHQSIGLFVHSFVNVSTNVWVSICWDSYLFESSLSILWNIHWEVELKIYPEVGSLGYVLTPCKLSRDHQRMFPAFFTFTAQGFVCKLKGRATLGKNQRLRNIDCDPCNLPCLLPSRW